VSAVLAEDFVMGKMFQHAGYRVSLAPTVLHNHTGTLSIGAFIRRHLRWAVLRWRLRPTAAALELLTSPLALLPALLLLFGVWGLAWAAALLVLRDVGGWIALRGPQGAYLPLLLSPVRDACMLAVWVVAPFVRHISWRGNRMRLGAGTLLFAQRLAPAARR
jgi:hypothetical protein